MAQQSYSPGINVRELTASLSAALAAVIGGQGSISTVEPRRPSATVPTSQPSAGVKELLLSLAREIQVAVGGGAGSSPTASSGSRLAASPTFGAMDSVSLHREYKVVIDGVQLPLDVASSINRAIQKAVMQELANLDTSGDFMMSLPLVEALRAEGNGGNGGGASVRFVPANRP